MPPSFRPATALDAPAVIALWLEAEAQPSHTDNVESVESVQRLIERDPAALIVVEVDHRLIGSVIAGWDGWRGSIYRLAVVPEHRRRGLARQLVRRAEERLAHAGAVRCQAIVVETEDQAVAFWRASGWEQQTERLRFVAG
jgi:ribosomal protein S18 acetylase RimI-like enzyme